MASNTAPAQPEIRKPIRRKIISVVLMGIATTVLLVTLANSWREAERYTDVKTREIRANASVLATAASDAIAAGNRNATLKTLRAIAKIPSFAYARAEDLDGKTIAELGSAVTLLEPEDRPILLRSSLSVEVDVIRGGEKVGRLVVLALTDDLREKLLDGLLVGLLSAFLSGAIGVLIAFRLQRRITEPLRSLMRTMFDVEQTQSFRQEVDHKSDDETGVLVETFNNMLSQIRLRDERLARHREKLEDTVEERTRDLRTAKDAAEEANAAKSEFLATMSHEIRTPMNGMLVMAELLSSANLSDKHRRYADVVVKSGQSLLTIINDILDFSKIESGKMDMERIALDPSVVVDDVLNLFWDKAAGKGLDLAGYVAPDVPPQVLGDPVRLNQVVSNLVNNALKFTESGHVVVRVTSEEVSGGRALRFCVADTGIGIAEDKLGTVFESFSQADQTTTRRFGGTGLGLAICKRLIGAMGGSISVNSEVGKGSEFYFLVPCEEPEEQRKPTEINTRGALQNAAVCFSDTATAQVIADYLSDFGFEVLVASEMDTDAKPYKAYDLVLAEPRMLEAIAIDGQEHTPPPFMVSVSQIGDVLTDRLIANEQVHDVVMRPVSRNTMIELVARLGRGEPQGRDLLKKRKARALPSYPDVRLLVADDSPVNREVIVEALKQMEISADLVENGREAVEAAMRNTYDLIFMDCSMPEMDGFEATRQIRKAEAETGAHVPIVALTAQVAGTGENEWRDAGMDAYLTKPFRITDLSEIFDTYINNDDEDSSVASEHDGSDGVVRGNAEDSNALPVIDEQVLHEALGCQPEEMTEAVSRMLNLFAEHAPGSLLKVAEAAKSGDAKALASTAHALKSMASNIGARRLEFACQQLESDAKSGQLENLATQLVSLQNDLIAVLNRIKARETHDITKFDGVDTPAGVNS